MPIQTSLNISSALVVDYSVMVGAPRDDGAKRKKRSKDKSKNADGGEPSGPLLIDVRIYWKHRHLELDPDEDPNTLPAGGVAGTYGEWSWIEWSDQPVNAVNTYTVKLKEKSSGLSEVRGCINLPDHPCDTIAILLP